MHAWRPHREQFPESSLASSETRMDWRGPTSLQKSHKEESDTAIPGNTDGHSIAMQTWKPISKVGWLWKNFEINVQIAVLKCLTEKIVTDSAAFELSWFTTILSTFIHMFGYFWLNQ